MPQEPDTFETWIATVPAGERSDPIWRMRSYRLARFIGSTVWRDAEAIRGRPSGYAVADQLVRAVHSIAANLAEGYSRGSGRDRVRLYEYALGSAREAVAWYRAAEPLISRSDVEARLAVLTEIRRLLLATIKTDRNRHLANIPGKP